MVFSENNSSFSGKSSDFTLPKKTCLPGVLWHIILFCFAWVLLLLYWPVSGLLLQTTSDDVFWLPCPLGLSFSTQLVHSVQLTPVEEEYFVHGGKIWSWQERVQSYGAGLPSTYPSKGRAFFDEPWMIIEGRREAFGEIFYRTGTGELGKNTLFLGNQALILLYKVLPSERIRLSFAKRCFLWGRYKKIE